MVEVLALQSWLLVVLIFLSAFFSGVEAAFLSLSQIDQKGMIERKLRWARKVKELKDEPHKLVITILIGNNLVNIAASTIAASVALQLFESNALAISTGIMTLLILIFGEITPKTLAIAHRETVTRVAAWPLHILKIVLYPAILVLDRFTKFVSRLFNAHKEEKVTEEEIRSVVSLGEESGSIEREERWMINNILKFDVIEVSEIMTPRADMYFVEPTATLNEITRIIIKSGRSRLPVLENDQVVGVIFIKDIFEALTKNQGQSKVSSIMKKPLIVPEQKKIDELFKLFQKKKVHIGIVVDEYGTVSGLVTIEDILEEIVGEIYDETDRRQVHIKEIDRTTSLISGGVRIEKLNERLGIGLKESDEYDTISGFLLKKLGRIPRTGERVTHKKLVFVVEKADEHRISEIRLIRP